MEIGATRYGKRPGHFKKGGHPLRSTKKPHGPKCWNCGGFGHMAKNCPSKKTGGQRMNIGTATTTVVENKPTEQYVCALSEDSLLYLHAEVQGREVKALVDSGATNNFVKKSLVEELRLPVKSGPMTELRMANRQVDMVSKLVEIELNLEGAIEKHEFVVAGLKFDLVLGLPWLKKAKVTIEAKNDMEFMVSWNGRTITKNLQLPIPLVSGAVVRKEKKAGSAIYAVYCRRVDMDNRRTKGG